MSKLNVETGQNVVIKKELANIGERIGAQLLDYLIILISALIIMFIFNMLSEIIGKKVDVLMFVFLAPLLFYSLLSEIFMQGQSLGKKVLKIKVVKLSGEQPTIGSYIIRWMFRLIDINFLYGAVGMITIAATGKGQRVGDIVAKTSVISLKRQKSLENTIFVELEDDYVAKYPEVEKLEASDIKTIKDVIAHYKKNITKPIAIDMIKNTTKAIKEKMGIENSDVPLLFLETILKDYNSIHKQELKY